MVIKRLFDLLKVNVEVVTGGQYAGQTADGKPHAETVTVTLTQNPGEGTSTPPGA